MPRIKQYADKYAMQDLGNHIIGKMAEQKVRQHQLGDALGMNQPSISKMLAHPERITAQEIRKISTVVKLDPAVVMKTLGF